MLTFEENLRFIGSCFGEHISERFSALKSDVDFNPLGTCYHPIQIIKIIDHLLGIHHLDPYDVISHDGLFKHPMLHSSMNNLSKEDLISRVKELYGYWTGNQTPDQLFITFGTAIGYRRKEDNKFVGNCHGMSKDLFNQIVTTSDEIYLIIEKAIKGWKSAINELNIILTISPVRYIKYGYVRNNVSKANLIIAVDRLSKLQNVTYIPVYEWVIDELRDFLYFDIKGSHPNERAQEYVFKKLLSLYFNTNDQELIAQIEEINRAVHYQPDHVEADSYQKFLPKIIEKTTIISQQHMLDFDQEIEILKSRLIS